MTAQFPERLILDGTETEMAFCPPIPEDHPRIRWLSDDEMRGANPLLGCTACWRGYVGTWVIEGGRFHFAGAPGRIEVSGPGPVFADWFTGVLRLPQGELLHYVHMGFGSVYKRELHVKIEAGVVVARREIDNRDKPKPGFDAGWDHMPGRENRFAGDDL